MKSFLFWIALLGSSSFASSVDPDVHWRTLSTPHFEVIYNRNQRELADRYAVAAEQAYDILQTRFSELPKKTYLVLDDSFDLTNGSATFLPYPAIVIYPVLPDALISLDYYGNWPLEMILHEYTHILEFEPVHGFYVPFKYVFGSIVHPNGLLPRWYLEGLSVDSETRFTEFGRLKSPRTFADFRALVEDGQLRRETIDRIDETMLPDYPYGERPYLFGSALINYVVEHGPNRIVNDLNQDFSRRFPWLIEGPIRNYYDANWQHLLTFTYNDIEKNANRQIAAIQAKGKDAYRPFQDDDKEQNAPAVSPDGHSLIYLTNSLRRGQIRWIRRSNATSSDATSSNATSFSTLKSEKIYDLNGALRLSWLPNSESFVFDQIDEMEHFHHYREIYQFNLKERSVRRLTEGLRAQEPAASMDGRSIAFIANSGASQWLGILDLESRAAKKLFQAPIFERLSHPEFISSHELALTHRNGVGEEHLEVFDLNDLTRKIYFPKLTELRRPKITSLGLLVATSESGVANIAIADLSKGTLQPITNTTTEMLTADWDPLAKELITSRATGKGRRLIALTPANQSPPTIGSVFSTEWPKPPIPTAVSMKDFKEDSYEPIEYLWPRYWIPFAYPVYNGVYLSGSTTMSDPAGINSYTASVAYDTVTEHGQFGIQYVNASLPPDIETQYVKSEQYLGASGDVLSEQTAIGDLAFYLPWLSPRWKASAGYIWDQMDTPWDSRFNRLGPLASLGFSDWDDPRAEGAGTILSLTHEQFLPGGGPGQLAYGRSVGAVTQAWKAGLPDSHRIVVTARTALSPDLPFQDLISLGDESLGANYLVSLNNSQFLFRGYPTGTFIGRKLLNWNLEYQFPLSKVSHGWGTAPLFSRGWDLALFSDGLAVDGAYYNTTEQLYRIRRLTDFALSTGAEARWNTTVFYGMPITAIFGLYFGFDDLARNSVMPFIGIAASDLSAIDHLRKKWFKRW